MCLFRCSYRIGCARFTALTGWDVFVLLLLQEWMCFFSVITRRAACFAAFTGRDVFVLLLIEGGVCHRKGCACFAALQVYACFAALTVRVVLALCSLRDILLAGICLLHCSHRDVLALLLS